MKIRKKDIQFFFGGLWIAICTELTKSGNVEISMGISKCIIMDRNYSADTEIVWGGQSSII